jgi:hypothetical protein
MMVSLLVGVNVGASFIADAVVKSRVNLPQRREERPAKLFPERDKQTNSLLYNETEIAQPRNWVSMQRLL